MKGLSLFACLIPCVTILALSSGCSSISAIGKSGESDAAPSTKKIAKRMELNDPQNGETAKLYMPSMDQLPKDAVKIRNIEFTRTPQGPVYLDIYIPANTQEPLPLIVNIHGGGWHVVPGARDGFLPGRMVGRGYVLASIDYRDSKDTIFPAQIQDCKAAIRFLRANAQKYHIDPDRIGVWGASAGGHLASLLGTSGGNDKLEDNGGNKEYSSRVQAVCDFCGPTDVKNLRAPTGSTFTELVESIRQDFVGGDPDKKGDLFAMADPVNYVSEDDPPFLIMHGDSDSLVYPAQSERLYEALRAKGVEVTYCLLKGAEHIFWGEQIDREIDAFFDKHLKGNGTR